MSGTRVEHLKRLFSHWLKVVSFKKKKKILYGAKSCVKYTVLTYGGRVRTIGSSAGHIGPVLLEVTTHQRVESVNKKHEVSKMSYRAIRSPSRKRYLHRCDRIKCIDRRIRTIQDSVFEFEFKGPKKKKLQNSVLNRSRVHFLDEFKTVFVFLILLLGSSGR